MIRTTMTNNSTMNVTIDSIISHIRRTNYGRWYTGESVTTVGGYKAQIWTQTKRHKKTRIIRTKTS